MTFHLNIFSSLGLIIDISGVILLFIYGLPSKISEGIYFIDGETDEERTLREKRNKFIKKMAQAGLICLILGFILQLIGSNVSVLK